MMKTRLLLLLSLIFLLGLAACAPQPGPDSSAGEVEAPAPEAAAQGGIYIHATSADATILNPILSSDAASSSVHQHLFPRLLGVDPVSGLYVPTDMAESWDTSPDGLVWTFHLRDDVFWSDGEQVDADDFKFTYDAIASDNVETPRKSNVEQIESIEILDPLTIQVTFKTVKCDALADLILRWLPGHLYSDDFTDIMESEMNTAPTVSAGPLIFQDWSVDERVTLVRNDTYWQGAPNMDGWVFKTVPDPGARLGQLQTGEVDYITDGARCVRDPRAEPDQAYRHHHGLPGVPGRGHLADRRRADRGDEWHARH